MQKKKKIIIAGPRDYPGNHAEEKYVISRIRELGRLYNMYKDCIIVEGGAAGIDSTAKKIAMASSIPLREYPAEWNVYGSKAGPIRNAQMAEYADVLIAFYSGSKGTSNMISQALEHGLDIHIIPVKKFG